MEQVTEVVRCRRIEVVDKEGVTRVAIGVEDQPGGGWDAAVVRLCSPMGRDHVSLYCDAESAGLELAEQGNTVAAVASTREGAAGIELNRASDAEGVVRLENTVPATFKLRLDEEGGASTLARFNVPPRTRRRWWPFGLGGS